MPRPCSLLRVAALQRWSWVASASRPYCRIYPARTGRFFRLCHRSSLHQVCPEVRVVSELWQTQSGRKSSHCCPSDIRNRAKARRCRSRRGQHGRNAKDDFWVLSFFGHLASNQGGLVLVRSVNRYTPCSPRFVGGNVGINRKAAFSCVLSI